ncbi:putative ABC transport system permease protein [Mesocricetibacter intestinalis]|uniref:Putative ABC transport system permease protein n=1 Tax=Mesocricetibacter intestinalis TaxID=1521930 RepID=A0A4R6VBZ1_9PAST|nr:ABC transporter permease [Mesocricetibacter intestinalis]TDQ59416.1 putative ABC transport system permease protein [Mesocricetibacter intestinalis]
MLYFKLLWLNLYKNKFGSLMIVLLIALSVGLSICLNLQERAFREGSAAAAERFDLVIGAPGSETQLVLSSVFLQPAPLPLIPVSHLHALQQDPRVAWASPLAFGDFTKGMPIVGTDKNFVLNAANSLISGRVFAEPFEAVAGANSGYAIGDKFSPLHGQIGEEGAHHHKHIEYEVVGIRAQDHSAWDHAVLVPLETLWQVHEHQREEKGQPSSASAAEPNDVAHSHSEPGVSAIVVKPKSIAAAYQLRSQYRNEQTQGLFPAEVLVKVYALLGDAKQVLSWVAVVTQILVAIALLMIISLYLKGQQRQIAAWRVFGAPRGKILWLIWGGLFMLITLSVLIGVGAGYGAALLISRQIGMNSGFLLPLSLRAQDIYHILLILLSAGLMALIPLLRLYGRSPIRILREQD